LRTPNHGVACFFALDEVVDRELVGLRLHQPVVHPRSPLT
jgi:hypothetical protein